MDNERDAIEFLWTFAPRLSVLFLCLLNTQCLAMEVLPKYSPIAKVTGHQ